jgi:deoxyribodipyrimidine photo-lyase
MPDVFTPFRKRIENLPRLGRPPFPIPSPFKPYPRPPSDSQPWPGYGAHIELEHRGLEYVLHCLLRPLQDTFQLRAGSEGKNQKSAFPYAGGETPALERLEWYFKEGNPPPVARYKETRNGLLGHSYSTKLSPFLSFGFISPRLIVKALDEYDEKFRSTQNTYWIRFELLWRDYFLYAARCVERAPWRDES